ncbi:MAG: 3,4-dihydroxy-2-butanone-4-phosphate synthase [Desulfurococcales archaeon]|nr:3,4-dihydroxy-2-butanone-4-phosphate synthase [Desulfurococcales archaeon]
MWRRVIDEAIEALARGRPVMIHDSGGREDEIDLVYYAGSVGADEVYTLRTRAGGLICYATTLNVVRSLNLMFMDELLEKIGGIYRSLAVKLPSYGDRPAFVLWVNHVATKTGISDDDRALTIRKLHEVTDMVIRGDIERARRAFESEFQSPGHVPLLAARSLDVRRGHTELSIALTKLAGLRPSVVFAEMLTRGGRLRLEEARVLAEKNGWPLVEGDHIVEACRNDAVCRGD